MDFFLKCLGKHFRSQTLQVSIRSLLGTAGRFDIVLHLSPAAVAIVCLLYRDVHALVCVSKSYCDWTLLCVLKMEIH